MSEVIINGEPIPTHHAVAARIAHLEAWAHVAEEALGVAEASLEVEGCDCGTGDEEPPCALCYVQAALKAIQKP